MAPISGRPARLISGNQLILVTEQGAHHRVRLIGIHTPSPHEKPGAEAMRYLRGLIMGRFLTLKHAFADSEGQLTGYLFHGGADVNIRMIQSGLARHDPYGQSEPARIRYAESEKEAKQKKRGLWNHRTRDDLGRTIPGGPLLRRR
ncbi:MAG: hypothetical protein GY703_03035 [Gammaproteobacteria bacterium]|nr:hypothetical protein [Gammaproteobacteria bacterium]